MSATDNLFVHSALPPVTNLKHIQVIKLDYKKKWNLNSQAVKKGVAHAKKTVWKNRRSNLPELLLLNIFPLS